MKTFTQLVGSTATTSAVSYPSSFTTLSQNNSSANVALGGQLVNDQHRYTIQKYFDNERTVTTSTVGGMSLTLTGSLAINAVSATLTVAWAYPTCSQLVNFSGGEQRTVFFVKSSTAITWADGLTATATTAIATVGVQDYTIPANISKIINDKINVGQLSYQPTPIMSRAEWDIINFLPYTSDIPNYYFIYNGKLSIFPIPSTTGNIITFNFKSRVPDLNFADYSTGTLAASGMVAGSITVTGLATSWSATGGYPTGIDISFYNLFIRANPPYGDGIWYPIRTFNSDTSITLASPVINAPNITTATTYTIGQLPLLSEDFHDMLVYGALMIYFSTIVKDKIKYDEFEREYNKRLEMLEAYAGTKSINVDLGLEPNPVNPNLFLYASN